MAIVESSRSDQEAQADGKEVIFISYPHRSPEAERARLLANELTRKFDVFIDYQIAPGSRWEAVLDDKLGKANAAVIFVDPKVEPLGVQSAEISAILARADSSSLRPIPVLSSWLPTQSESPPRLWLERLLRYQAIAWTDSGQAAQAITEALEKVDIASFRPPDDKGIANETSPLSAGASLPTPRRRDRAKSWLRPRIALLLAGSVTTTVLAFWLVMSRAAPPQSTESILGHLPALMGIATEGTVVGWTVIPKVHGENPADFHYGQLVKPEDYTGFLRPSGGYFVFHNYSRMRAQVRARITTQGRLLAIAEQHGGSAHVTISQLPGTIHSKHGLLIEDMAPGAEVIIAIGTTTLRPSEPLPTVDRIDEIAGEDSSTGSIILWDQLASLSPAKVSLLVDYLSASSSWLVQAMLAGSLGELYPRETADKICALSQNRSVEGYPRLLAAQVLVGNPAIDWRACVERALSVLEVEYLPSLFTVLKKAPVAETAPLYLSLFSSSGEDRLEALLQGLPQSDDEACGDLYGPLLDGWQSGKFPKLDSTIRLNDNVKPTPYASRLFLVASRSCGAVARDVPLSSFVENKICSGCARLSAGACRSLLEGLQPAMGQDFDNYLWKCAERQSDANRSLLLASLPKTTDARWIGELRTRLRSGTPADLRAAFAALDSLPKREVRVELEKAYRDECSEDVESCSKYFWAMAQVGAKLDKKIVLRLIDDPRYKANLIDIVPLANPELTGVEHYELWKRTRGAYSIPDSLKTALASTKNEADGLTARILVDMTRSGGDDLARYGSILSSLPDPALCSVLHSLLTVPRSRDDRVTLMNLASNQMWRGSCVGDEWFKLVSDLREDAAPVVRQNVAQLLQSMLRLSNLSSSMRARIITALGPLAEDSSLDTATAALHGLCDYGWSQEQESSFLKRQMVRDADTAARAMACLGERKQTVLGMEEKRLIAAVLESGGEGSCRSALYILRDACSSEAKSLAILASHRSDGCSKDADSALKHLQLCGELAVPR